MSAPRSLTLADVALPRAGVLQNIVLLLIASIVTALAAQVEIKLPWSPVPITGQTFAVMLCGAVLGARRGFAAQLLYLAQGAAGLPVFSGGASGVHHLIGPTAGYLIAFPLAAWITGTLAERGWDRNVFTMFAAMLLGSTIIFGLGLAWLSRFVPQGALLQTGLLPFLPGDLIKSALAALAFPAAWRLAHRGGPGARA